MKRPSFQFYPGDWRGNAKLRRCSEAARGAWLDILCVLHDSDEYGVCRWPLAEIAQAAGVSLRAARELVQKGVLKGSDVNSEPFVYTPVHAREKGSPVTLIAGGDGPCWYSSRLVRDEWVRQNRGGSSRFGADKSAPKPSPKPSPTQRNGERQGDGSSSSSSSSSSKETKAPPSRSSGEGVEIPDWVPRLQWDAFVAMRSKLRAPITGRAVKLAINSLEELRKSGHDPGDVLDQSVLNSWKGLFPIKGSGDGYAKRPTAHDKFLAGALAFIDECDEGSAAQRGGGQDHGGGS